MNINSPYVPTATQLKDATPFANFDSGLFVTYDQDASKVLGKDFYKVTQSFRFYLSEKHPDVWGYIPAGFLTDGATVPRPFWWLLPPWGNYGQAAVLHDILCETLTMFKDEIPYPITRKEADDLFLEGMEATQVHWLPRYVMYGAVRLWSFFGFKRNRSLQAQKHAIEVEYMKAYGTYREPTAILRQVTRALSTAPRGAVVQSV